MSDTHIDGRSELSRRFFPNPDDEKFVQMDMATLRDHILSEMMDFAMDRKLPIYFCWNAALMAIAKVVVTEARVRGREIPKIGAAWAQFVETEHKMLDRDKSVVTQQEPVVESQT
jgi:hypothetical protein